MHGLLLPAVTGVTQPHRARTGNPDEPRVLVSSAPLGYGPMLPLVLGEVTAARPGDGPLHFARLRAPQMLVGVVDLATALARVLRG